MLVQKFKLEMLSELEALTGDVREAGRSDLLPLDLSYASLDRAEDFYLLVADKQVSLDKERTKRRVARYAGATLVEHAGGEWAAGDNERVPAVTKLHAAPHALVEPMARVWELEKFRYSGWLRDRIERNDVELQTTLITDLTGDPGGTLTELRAAAKALAGSDPGLLDATAALDRYQPVLAQAVLAGTSRELRRVIQRGTAIAIGELLQAELGRSAWTVDDDGRNVDFGAWSLFGINLTNLVERVEPEDAPGAVRLMVEKMIAKRRRRES
jgi:hypothetical protein